MLPDLLYKTGHILISAYARLMLEMDIHWHGGSPDGPVLFAANHPSTTDPVFIHLISRQPMSVMISQKVFSVPVLGAYMRRMDQIEVLDGKGEQVLDQAQATLQAGRSVTIFPEGAISPPNGFAPVRTGVARLALRSGVPVVPVGISLRDENVKHIPTVLAGEPDVITWYLRGPYAITIGAPMHFYGEVHDRTLVRNTAEAVMAQIRALTLESQRRVALPAAVRTSGDIYGGCYYRVLRT
jgi:1-acyl-sn-glycerol-3-phosphate acyltransferase